MQRWLLTGFLLVATPFGLLYSQTNTLGQFWNELSFSRAAFKKSALELDLGQSWTGTPDHKSMFAENAQIYVRGWVHIIIRQDGNSLFSLLIIPIKTFLK